MNYKLSFSTASLFPRYSLDALRMIQDSGFLYAELMPQCYEEIKASFARAILDEIKIKIASVHFPLVLFSIFYNPYPGAVKESRKLVDNITEMAEMLDSEVIVIHPPRLDNETIRKLFHDAIIDNIRYLCEVSQKHGIKIALENMPNGGRTLEELQNIIKEIDHENIFPMLDTTEAMESDQNPINMLKRMNLIHIHISDYDTGKKHLIPGEGKIDWSEFFNILKKKQFAGFITVEPSYKYLIENPVEKMVKVRVFLEKLLR